MRKVIEIFIAAVLNGKRIGVKGIICWAVLVFATAAANPTFGQADTTPTRDNNLAMGNPSRATTAPTDSNNYLLSRSQYTLSYNNSKGMANWVSWHLSAAWKGASVRCNCFTQDSVLPSGYYRASTGNYTGTGFDRGHLCPSDDRDGSDSDNERTFKMTNISPQAPILNQETWGDLEDYSRSLLGLGNELYIIAGGIGTGGSGSGGGTTNTIASGRINVPSYYWKVIVVLPVDSADVRRVATTTRVIAVLMPNNQTVNAHSWDYYRVPVDSIETLTGYDFLSNIDTAIQRIIEARTDAGATNVLAWDFTGANNVATWAATSVNSNLDTAGGALLITRGSGAAGSTGANSFRTAGFQNNGISTANTDYFQIKLKADTGYTLSLFTLDARFNGTGSFCASPGVSAQFAYSLDGTSFTLIGSPFTTIGAPATMSTQTISGVTALQNLSAAQTVYLRYYASGQTTTGGWGFYSFDTGINGLSIGGSVTPLGAISGANAVCVADTATYSHNISGGVWSSSNTGIAVVGSATGVITGVASGTSIITYSIAGSRLTKTITVNPLPNAGTIAGPSSVATGATITLTTGVTGGVWSSSATGIATVAAGVVTGVATGSAIISYAVTNSCGVSVAVKSVTVTSSSIGGIHGVSALCVGASAIFSHDSSGGVWTSSNPAIATVDSATGRLNTLLPGSVVISYTLVSGVATAAVAINPLPAAITGATALCAPSSSALSSASTGGIWTSADRTIATIGSTTGIVSALSNGVAAITYTLPTGCWQTVSVTVSSVAAITGPTGVCVGQSITLSDATPGGLWTSSNPTVARIGSTTGVVTGVAGGTATIVYTVGGCRASSVINTSVLSPISGTLSVCGGGATTLTEVGSGIWTSSDNAVATVGSTTGVVSGISTGTSVISFTLGSGCAAAATVTVSPMSAITGSSTVCTGQSTTLSNSVPGGLWTVTNTLIARIGSATGIVTGIAGGYTNVTYSLGGCRSVTGITVGSIGAVSGAASVCGGQSTAFTCSPSGGVWSSSDPAIATVNTSTGVVAGVTAGSAIITYTLAGGCAVTKTITVNALGAITGGATVCVGQTLALTNSAPGGVWTSSNPTIATIGSASGIVSGIAGGSLSISYTIGACRATTAFTVNRLSPIGGAAAVCEGQTTGLTNVNSGGVWTSSNTAVATIGSVSATVAGIAAGTTVISYTLATGCAATRVQTVNPIVAIGGPTAMCLSAPATLTNAVGGGVWTSNNTTIARIGSASGIATGVTGGATIIVYTIPATGCRVTAPMTVNNCRVANNDALNDKLTLFIVPNPNGGNFMLSGSVPVSVTSQLTISITDIVGRTVYTAQITATDNSINEPISLPQSAAKGTYILSVRGSGHYEVVRFVVE